MLLLDLVAVGVVLGVCGAARTCVSVQNALMSCVTRSEAELGLAARDVRRQCRQVRRVLRCVRDARGACPGLPMLHHADFARAVSFMEAQRRTQCRRHKLTEITTTANPSTVFTPLGQTAATAEVGKVEGSNPAGAMASDQPTRCDPVADMLDCNRHMAGVEPGDVKAMCIPGDAYLSCLAEIVRTCPGDVAQLPIDLGGAIATTRDVLRYECKSVLEEKRRCHDDLEDTKRYCADHLNGAADYCRSLEQYMSCVRGTLISCPDIRLQNDLKNQYTHHCSKDVKDGSCPVDIPAAIKKCEPSDTSHSAVKGSYCRSLRRQRGCLGTLRARCRGGRGFKAAMPLSTLRTLRRHVRLVCSTHTETSKRPT